MIALEGASARALSRPGEVASSIKDVTVTWAEGVLAVLGARADGTVALLEAIAGMVRVRSGEVLVDGQAPARARASVAYVPRATNLPDSLRVDEVCELAGQLRGEASQSPESRLHVLGLETLARRLVHTLSPGESRAVTLAIALTSKVPVLLVDEPLVGLDPAASSRVIEALRERAKTAAVIVTTASVRDATRLADQLGVLTGGAFTHLSPTLAHVGAEGAVLRLVVAIESELSPFVEALSQEPAVAGVQTSAFAAKGALAVVVSGTDLLTLARAVGAAAARAGAKIEAIESAVTSLDAIRAALAGPRPGVLSSRPPPPGAGTVPQAEEAPPAEQANP
jgi:ABC-type multidrug transport system ATPase subunit